MKKLLLIDANSIIHRCFHALPPLTTRGGAASQAVYGIASILLRLYREDKPEYAAALFDRPEPTFRKLKYGEYKAHRPKATDELVSQIIEAHNLFRVFGIRPFEAPGWEADDLIATLARRFAAIPDVQVVILTGDLDTLQLVVGDKVVVRTFRKGISDTVTYGEAAVLERYGLRPDQLPDYKALVGDVSDNVKGVPGVGPKTAVQILAEFESLEHALAHAADHPKLKDKLLPFKEQAELSLELVRLHTYEDLPVRDLAELEVKTDPAAIDAYFAEFGFETLRKRFAAGDAPLPKAKKEPEKEAEPPRSAQGSIF